MEKKHDITELQSQVMKSGIYFNLSNEDYHNDKSVSNSSMSQLLKTPLHYWHNSAMNPNKEPLDTLALKNGKVLHTLLLEPHKFHEEWKIKAGVKNTTSAGMIGEGAYNELKEAVAALRSDKIIAGLFSYGFPEVSIFWVDLETGVPCRARMDYLSSILISDLKGCADVSNQKIGYSIVDYGYFRQQAFYLDAVEIIKGIIRSGVPVHNDCPDKIWFSRFMESVHNKFAFVFQEKTAPFVTRAEQLCERTYEIGQGSYRQALSIFKQNYEKHGAEKWPSGYEGKVGLMQLDDLPAKINYIF